MPVPAETNNGDITSWIPLTNVFTPSSGCESIFRLNGPSLVAFDPGYGLDIDTLVRCVPPAVTTWWEQARLGVGGDEHTALSIQPLTCPHLWTTVATFMKDTSTTQIMCCPSGYSNRDATSGPVNGNCISGISKGMILTYASTPSTATTDWSIVTTTMSTSSSVGAIAVVGFNVARAASTSTPDPSTSSTKVTSESPSAISSGINISSNSSNGMPTGIKAGIGLGVSLGVLGIAALIFAILILRRRNQKKSDGSNTIAPELVSENRSKNMSTFLHNPQDHHGPISELHGNNQPHELPSGEAHSPVEMGTQDH